MIGSTYTSKAIQAVLGPSHSGVIPAVLWGGWLDSGLSVLGYSGISVPHDVFGPATDGIVNIDTVDGGVAGTGWTIAYFGLFDAASGGNLVAYAAVTATPSAGDPLLFTAGNLTFTYA